MEKIIPISLELNFTPNILGFYGLSSKSEIKLVLGKIRVFFVQGVS